MLINTLVVVSNSVRYLLNGAPMDESKPVETYSVYELVEILITRGRESNGFEFVTAEQMAALLSEWRREAPEAETKQV